MSLSKIKKSHLTFKQILEGGNRVYSATWWEKWLQWTEVVAKKYDKLPTEQIKIMSQLDHPNIVKLLAFVDEAPEFYLVFETCTRFSLKNYLHGHWQLDRDKCFNLIKDAAESIHYLKQKNIVHNNITSSSYAVDWTMSGGFFSTKWNHRLKLTNFKHAKQIDITITNKIKQDSFPWMAPELLAAEDDPFPTIDVFSFGVVVWEIYTRRSPFDILHELPQTPTGRGWGSVNYLPIPASCSESLRNLMKLCWEED